MQTARFFNDLTTWLEGVRQAKRDAFARFFADLHPRFAEARRQDRERERHEAYRFNALHYLRTDELGLSRIVADLLKPSASHGQGADFLKKLLLRLRESTPFQPDLDFDPRQVSVHREHITDTGRKIDIVVRIACARSSFVLAIENKPYDRDRRHQVRDYLHYLRRTYRQNFLLIYLSPGGEGPSQRSVRRQELVENWYGHFAILAYSRSHSVIDRDEFDSFRLPFSLAQWLKSCRDGCRAKRLRWFLDETRRFCKHTFGEPTMPADLESREIRKFLRENPVHLDLALAVHESWPSVRDAVCKRFIERLRARISASRALASCAGDLSVVCRYHGDANNSNGIWLFRDSWKPYRTIKTAKAPPTSGRTSIELSNSNKGPNGWYIGVRVPESADNPPHDEQTRRQNLVESVTGKFNLGDGSDEVWPWYVYADRDRRHWNSSISDLHSENEADEDGDMTRYFVDKMVEHAAKAIPLIDDVDG
ncbi:MAG: hypothetical protein F4053_01195 [Proteobacteria bacterium]|nr:hypothetical protein [Pseudomonadota bacterium]